MVNVYGLSNDYALHDLTSDGVDTVGSGVQIPTRLPLTNRFSIQRNYIALAVERQLEVPRGTRSKVR